MVILVRRSEDDIDQHTTPVGCVDGRQKKGKVPSARGPSPSSNYSPRETLLLRVRGGAQEAGETALEGRTSLVLLGEMLCPYAPARDQRPLGSAPYLAAKCSSGEKPFIRSHTPVRRPAAIAQRAAYEFVTTLAVEKGLPARASD